MKRTKVRIVTKGRVRIGVSGRGTMGESQMRVYRPQRGARRLFQSRKPRVAHRGSVQPARRRNALLRDEHAGRRTATWVIVLTGVSLLPMMETGLAMRKAIATGKALARGVNTE